MTTPAKISDDTALAMPIRNIISIIGAVAVATWAYSGVIERLNRLETSYEVKAEAVELNSEFRINWPRGTMGQLPADASQDREIAQLQVELDRVMEEVEENDQWIDEYQPSEAARAAIEEIHELRTQVAIIQYQIDQLD